MISSKNNIDSPREEGEEHENCILDEIEFNDIKEDTEILHAKFKVNNIKKDNKIKNSKIYHYSQNSDKDTILVKNPLYNTYKKASKVFAFLILNLIILGWLNIFPPIAIIPGITGSTILLLIFLDEILRREFIEKKII